MTTFTDGFARADATSLGNGWTEYTNGFKIVSGAAVPETTATNAARSPALATGNHYAEMVVGNTYGGSFTGPCVRMPALGADGTTTGTFYALWLSGTSGTAFSIRRKDANATSSVVLASGSTATDVRAEGLTMRLRVYDDPNTAGTVVLEGYVNGTKVVTATDTSGLVPNTQTGTGMYSSGSTATSLRVASFSAADQAAPAASTSGDTTPPAVPTGLTATTPAYLTVALSWSAVTATDLAGYRVYRSTGASVTTADELIGSPTGASFTDTNVVAGTTYRYGVTSVDTTGNQSAISTSVTKAPTTAPAAPAPTAGTSVGHAVWDGTQLVPVSVPLRGDSTANRPSAATAGTGTPFYDTTLKKPIWSDGTTWRDASGTAV